VTLAQQLSFKDPVEKKLKMRYVMQLPRPPPTAAADAAAASGT